MLEVVAGLGVEIPNETSEDYPYLLSAGERRTYTANTIVRDPAWRRKDVHGALYINPEDAARLNLGDGSAARLSTERGQMDVVVEMQSFLNLSLAEIMLGRMSQ